MLSFSLIFDFLASRTDIVLPLHLLSLAYVAWNVLHADHMGLSWIRGKYELLEADQVAKYHRGTWIGLCSMIVTGFILFWPMRDFLLTRPQFYVKMAFVVTLVINAFVIGTLSKISLEKPFAVLTSKEKLPLFISGAISTFAWVGAAGVAFFLLPD